MNSSIDTRLCICKPRESGLKPGAYGEGPATRCLKCRGIVLNPEPVETNLLETDFEKFWNGLPFLLKCVMNKNFGRACFTRGALFGVTRCRDTYQKYVERISQTNP